MGQRQSVFDNFKGWVGLYPLFEDEEHFSRNIYGMFTIPLPNEKDSKWTLLPYYEDEDNDEENEDKDNFQDFNDMEHFHIPYYFSYEVDDDNDEELLSV
ncbi:hypothetical protein GWI33_018754 [Rhynchophorus ferrugineus]|uniref:Uncharacterized protein n=1 Tax=Rhynchophorus ferrugineus TaxID=354439 RepID=A0A834M272_RHYFE|nr:hypothetical protein GWI33_018754 [Rhynchophorus ferrugineus]